MSLLRKNIAANYLGQGWAALMGLAFIPLYIKYLGMEAYGLIGLFSIMQVWLTLLDMGMTPTLTREMGRFTAGAHSSQSISNLLRSLEILCFSLAALIGLVVWSASGYLASDWLKAEKLPTEVVAQGLSVMAVVVAFRFVEGIYRGSLFGLQRQVLYNGINSILAAVRHGGAVAVLAWVSPTVQTFFIWQAIISLLTVAVLSVSVHRALPKPPFPPRFLLKALASVWQFAGGMMAITFFSLLLTQVDKILLSHLLTLESFGYYALAASGAGLIYMVIGPIAGAIFPQMVDLSTRDDQARLVPVYHLGAQLVTTLSAPAVMLLSFYAGGVVFMWSGNATLAENTAPILSALVLGTFLNGLMYMPGQLQVACGWTSLAIKTDIVALVALIPAIFWVVPRYGAVGAAWIWVVLNAGYILIAVQFMHRRLIPDEKWRWYFADVILPISAAMGVMLLAKQFQPASYQDRLQWLVFSFITGCLTLAASALLADRIRTRMLTIMHRFFHWSYV